MNIIGSHFVPLEVKFFTYSILVIVRITFNVIVRQMPLKCSLNNGVPIVQKLVVKLSNTSTMLNTIYIIKGRGRHDNMNRTSFLCGNRNRPHNTEH